VVSQSLTIVSAAITAKPINTSFGIWIQIGPRNHALDGGLDPPARRSNFEEESGSLL